MSQSEIRHDWTLTEVDQLFNQPFNDLMFQLHTVESSKHNYTRDRRYFFKRLIKQTENNYGEEWKAKIAAKQID